MRRIALAVFILTATLVLLPNTEAEATHRAPDDDGYVREYYSCSIPNAAEARRTPLRAGWHLYPAGWYLYLPEMRWYYFEAGYYWDDVGYDARIIYNHCIMQRAGAGYYDWRHVKAHERAHAMGNAHWEGSPRTNPAYYPGYRICRC